MTHSNAISSQCNCMETSWKRRPNNGSSWSGLTVWLLSLKIEWMFMNISWRLFTKCRSYIALQLSVFPIVNNNNLCLLPLSRCVCAQSFFPSISIQSFKHTVLLHHLIKFLRNAPLQIIIRWKATANAKSASMLAMLLCAVAAKNQIK